MPHQCRTSLFGLGVALCDRSGTRYNAGRIVRDLQVHTSCRPESVPAGERKWALLSPPKFLCCHFTEAHRHSHFVTKLELFALCTRGIVPHGDMTRNPLTATTAPSLDIQLSPRYAYN